MMPIWITVYCRRRVSEMEKLAFPFPSRGEQKEVEYPAACRGTPRKTHAFFGEGPGLALGY